MTTDDNPLSGRSAHYAEVPRSYYDIVMAVFVGLLIISGVTATKLFQGPVVPVLSDWFHGGGPLIFDGGAFLFPLSYVVGDIMTEVYGWKRARRAIWTGFALTLLAAVTYRIVALTTPVPGFEAWNSVLAPATRIAVAGLAGYLAGNLLNSFVVVRLKARAGENNVAARLIGSTLVGELVDTVLFCTIAFAGTITMAELGNYTVTGYLYKCLVEICVVPITLRIIAWLKRVEPTYGL
ncbi:queuosine precursor transporter [Luteococcus sp. OSA5]|uniref:queuosine precursor transporter n=1 Tax=Luteococcus sp. OSA5 TaxID=3401630 RepID=UPI003B42D809